MSTAFRFSIAIALAIAGVGCGDPQDRRPGLRLSGDVATEIPSDWSFTNEHREIAIEVSTPYLLPHSVTIWCAEADGRLYVGARNPDTKRWPSWVDRDPDVRLRIGEQIFEVRLVPVDDPGRLARVRSAYARKYDLPDPPPEESPPIRYWSVERRERGAV